MQGPVFPLRSPERVYVTKVRVMEMKRLFFIIGILLLSAPLVWAGERGPIHPGPRDKCPVCGMFVAKYPDFLAQIISKDGTYTVFDGGKDMMKYCFNLQKYNPTKGHADIDAIYVTDYYRLEFVNGFTALYVSGSDIYGPMGRELIPFEKKPEAEEFIRDHKGRSLHTFGDIDKPLVEDLD